MRFRRKPCISTHTGVVNHGRTLIIVVDEIDIWRTAKLLTDQHGNQAAIHAAMKADVLLEAADLDGYAVWRRIIVAIEEMQHTQANGATH